jgi:hypothetical protein
MPSCLSIIGKNQEGLLSCGKRQQKCPGRLHAGAFALSSVSTSFTMFQKVGLGCLIISLLEEVTLLVSLSLCSVCKNHLFFVSPFEKFCHQNFSVGDEDTHG